MIENKIENKKENKTEKRNLTALFSVTLFAYWMGFAAILTFASNYLLGLNVSNSTIGMVVALANIATAVLQPFLGTLSDKYAFCSAGRMTGFFMILVMVMAGGLLIIPGTSLTVICLLYGICILGNAMAQPFVNSLGMLCLNAGYPLDFGIARAAGSLGYAICAFLLGRLIDRFGVSVIPASFLLAFAIVLATLFAFPKINQGEREEKESDLPQANGNNFFRRYPAFTIMLAGLIGIYIGHILINNFALQIVETKGGSNTEMGTAAGMAAMIELLMMFLFTRVMKRVSLKRLIRISGIFFTLKVLGSLLVTGMTGFYLVQLMQLLGWGTMSVGLVYYVNGIMEPEDCVKGQAYATMTFTIANVIGAWAGGTMLDCLGVPAMLICGTIVSAAGAVIIWIGTGRQK